MYIYIYICIYIHTHICMCIHIYIYSPAPASPVDSLAEVAKRRSWNQTTSLSSYHNTYYYHHYSYYSYYYHYYYHICFFIFIIGGSRGDISRLALRPWPRIGSAIRPRHRGGRWAWPRAHKSSNPSPQILYRSSRYNRAAGKHAYVKHHVPYCWSPNYQ